MRLFKSDWVDRVLQVLKIPDDVPIENKRVTGAIANAQGQIESQNFESRKNVLKYDDVMDRQRHVIYDERRRVLEGADLKDQISTFVDDVVTGFVTGATQGFAEEWDLEGLWTELKQLWPVSIDLAVLEKQAGGRANIDRDQLIADLKADAHAAYARREDGGRRGGDARARAARHPLGARPQVARAPLRDGLPARGHLPARLLPARPARGVPARGLRHVRRGDGRHQGGVGRLPVQPRRPGRGGRRRGPRGGVRADARRAAERPGQVVDPARTTRRSPLRCSRSRGNVGRETPRVRAKGLDRPKQPQNLSYSAPSEQGEAEVAGATATNAGDEFAESAATSCAPAARARSTSAATARRAGRPG